MYKLKLPLILAILASLAFGCDQSPVFPLEPQIEFMDISPKEAIHLRDSVVIKFRFQDGDGDIGQDDSGENDLLIIDARYEDPSNGITRQDATIGYSMMNLTPDARKPAIQGEISVTIPVVYNLAGRRDEQVRFQIELRDRAGNTATGMDGSTTIYTDYIRVYR
ncbi:MAG: hypothetical protein AAFP02_07280 [Bacteroidota bacterium]